MEVAGKSDSSQHGAKPVARKRRFKTVEIVFPREEAYLDELGGVNEEISAANADSVAKQPEQTMTQLKFVNLHVTSPSTKKRQWIWRKIVPGIVFKRADWSREGPTPINQPYNCLVLSCVAFVCWWEGGVLISHH